MIKKIQVIIMKRASRDMTKQSIFIFIMKEMNSKLSKLEDNLSFSKEKQYYFCIFTVLNIEQIHWQ